jgi:hypothetical protein
VLSRPGEGKGPTTGVSVVGSTCRRAAPHGVVRAFRRLACAQTSRSRRTAEPCAPHARPRPCPQPQAPAAAVGPASQEVVLRPPTLAVLGPRRSPSSGVGARYRAPPPTATLSLRGKGSSATCVVLHCQRGTSRARAQRRRSSRKPNRKRDTDAPHTSSRSTPADGVP